MATTVVLDGNVAIGFDLQRNTRQSIVDALHDGPPRRKPQRQSIVDALDERPSRRTPHGPRKLRNRPRNSPLLENSAL